MSPANESQISSILLLTVEKKNSQTTTAFTETVLATPDFKAK